MLKRGIKIIVIDDDAGIIDCIQSIMGDKYHIEGYTSSKEGLKRLREEKFDLLILDYFIDELNGSDLIKELRKFNKEIYILLLTGNEEKVPGIKSLETLDIQNYYAKNADFEKLVVFLEGIIKSIEFFKNQKHTIGERIKELRKINNLTQDDVAKYLEMQRSNISLYESGDAIPPTLTIIKLAKLFNVTTDYILCYELNIDETNKKIDLKNKL